MKKLIIVPLLFICLLAKAQIPGLESMPRMGLPLQSTRLWSNGTRHLISDKDSIALIYFLKPVGTSGQYINGAGGLVTFPTAVSAFSNDATYITQTGARSAISTTGSLSYNSSTGVLSYTQPTNVSTFTNDAAYLTNTTGDLRYLLLTGGSLSGSLSVTGNGTFTNTVSGQRFAIGNGSNNKAVGAFGPVGVQGQYIPSNNVDGTTAANTTTPVVSSYVFGAVTYSAANTGQIYSTSATIDIKGASIASTNVSITAPLSLWVEAGKTLLSGALQVAANSDFSNINSGKLGAAIIANTPTGVVTDSIASKNAATGKFGAVPIGNFLLTGTTRTTNKLFGTGSGTTFSEITLGSGLSFTASTLNVSPVNRSHTIFTPSTGGTVTLINNQINIINPSGTLTTLTLALPSSPSNNDIVNIVFTQAVTALSYSGGTVVGSPNTASLGGQWYLTYDSSTTTWY